MLEANEGYGKGHFLVANPVLPDPNFSRTVVLLCNHDDNGSFGLVINRSAPISAKEVFTDMGVLGSPSGKIYIGKEVFVGSNTALIAPLNIGNKVTIGAGSVITQNIKTKSLAITRVKQREIKNWTAKNKKG